MQILNAKRKNTPNRLEDDQTIIATFRVDDRDYQLDCLTSIDEIRNIKADWQTLEQKSGAAFTYFQSFDWCYQWCVSKFDQDQINRGSKLSVYVLRSGDNVLVIFPLMEVKSSFGAKVLTLITDPLAQYANVIADIERVSAEAAREAWKLIRKHTTADAITIDYYPSGSFLAKVIDGEGFLEKSHTEASMLDLSNFDTWDDHSATLSRNQRKQRNRRRSKLAEKGEVTFLVNIGGSEEYAKHVKWALAMKQVWLSETGRSPGILAERDTEKFLTNLTGSQSASEDMPQGALTLTLCVDGVPVALEIGMIMGRHYYAYLGAFDWAWKDFSPGKIQMEAAQQWALSVGVDKYDFLGDPSDYKQYWSDASHRLYSRSIPLTSVGLLYCSLWKSRLRPKLKEAYKNMGTSNREMLSKLMVLGRGKSASGLPNQEIKGSGFKQTS